MRSVSLVLAVACVLLLFQRPTAGSAERTLAADLDPVILTGEALPSLAGTGLSQLFLCAYRMGAWSQVPWQIDEVQNGRIVESEDGKLDADDQLIFMASDTGDQAPTGDWISNANSRQYARYEIAVTDPADPSQRGWAYLYRSTTLTNTVASDYVNYDAAQSLIRAHEYSMRLLKGTGKVGVDLLEMHGSGVDIVDRTKIRALVPGYGAFTEDSIPIAVPMTLLRDGRVRTVVVSRAGSSDQVRAIGYRSRFDYAVHLPLPAAPSSGRVSVDLSPAASGSAYYDANTVEHVTIDGTPDIVATSPASRWFQVSGSTGSVVVAVDWPAEWNASTYYKDDKTIDPNDTGDKMSYGDPGVLVTQPGLWIDVALVAYILSPNQPRVGAAYSDRFRQPLQVQTADQRFGGSPTVTSIASSTPTRTPTPTRTVVPSRTPVWAHHVCLPVIVRMH